MTVQRHFKLARNSEADTISLPPEFALSSDDVIVRKEGDRLIIEPEITRNRQVNGALLAWLATQASLPREEAVDPVPRDGATRAVMERVATTVINNFGDEVANVSGAAL